MNQNAKNIILVIFVVFGVYYQTDIIHAKKDAAGDKMTVCRKEYEKDIKEITDHKHDAWKDYQSFIAEKVKKWKTNDNPYAPLFLVKICSLVQSHNVYDNPASEAERKERFQLASDYAWNFLNSSLNMSFEQKFELVRFLRISPETKEDITWSDERKKKITFLLDLWNKMISEIDPNVDVNEKLWVTVPLPAGAYSPDEIKDPAVKAQYEKAVEENKRKREAIRKKIYLQILSEQHPNAVEEQVILAYCQNPQKEQELQTLLDQYPNIPIERKKIILDTVKRTYSKNK